MRGRGTMVKLLLSFTLYSVLICSSLILYRFFPRAHLVRVKSKCYIEDKKKDYYN